MAFSHLHVHSQYSKLDGLATIQELLARAKELGQVALAITDHNTCSGLYDLYKYSKEYGIKPIYGCEFYLDNGMEEKLNHICLFAKNNEGLSNIFKLHEWSYAEGFKSKPCVTIEQLKAYSKGVIATSACLANIIPRAISEGDILIARQFIETFKNIYGEDFYLEVQDNDIMEQHIANKGIVKLGKEYGIKVIATNDVHYTLKEDWQVHDTLICMQTNQTKSDPKRFRFNGQSYWLKSEDEMLLSELTPEERKEALDNTQEIVEKCHATLVKGNYLPKYYATPEGKTEEQYLREMVTERYKTTIQAKGLHSKQYVEDVRHELDVIEQTGYAGYHLIVQDFVNYSRDNGILVGDGRGSGAGCKVAYILGITKVEPTAHNLLFERFLDYGRQPDYDIDFADNTAIFEYLQQKYGKHNVTRIVAFGTLAAKNVARRVFKAYGYDESIISQISGAIPDEPKITLKRAYTLSEKLRNFKVQYPKQFYEMEKLEGRICHASQHAGGVVIYPNISSIIPVHTDSDNREVRVCSFDKYMVEDLGFCKIDCLGLEALTTLNETVRSIRELEGVAIDFDQIDYEDPAIYEDLCKGNVYGIFQLEAQKDIVMKQQPKCFADIVALSSIIRPGTCDINEYLDKRKNHNHAIPEEQKGYMKESGGVIIYQEQYLLHCKTYAGWSIGFADKNVRKNKHLREDIELENKFIQDCITHSNLSESMAKAIWQEIVSVAGGGYGFNKSHAVSYSYITYRNAWLKHYYPIHFYASLLTKLYNNDNKKHLIHDVIAECKQINIKILPPDINKSLNNFIPTKEGIRYALTSVKGLGESALNYLLEIRPFNSLEDFVMRAERRHMKQNVVDNLIKCGCFDNEGKTRYEILKQYREMTKSKKEVEEKTNANYEYEVLGVYLQEHPMDRYAFSAFNQYPNNADVLIGGIVKKVDEKYDKKGNLMAFILIETKYGTTNCLAFSSYWTKAEKKKFADNQLVMIHGKKSNGSCIINKCTIIE